MVRFFSLLNVSQGNYPYVVGASIQKPKPTIDFSIRSRDRHVLRQAWNGTPLVSAGTVTIGSTISNRKIGSFRAVNNAGDLLSRKNYSCGGSNMISSRPGMMVLTTKDGGQDSRNCDNTGVEPATCNVKYVYDSSDFIRFKKLQAKNRGYTGGKDYSYGGAGGGTTKSVLNRVRR